MTPKQKREAAMLKQQAIVDAARADGGRALTEEEQAEFNSYQREIEQSDAEIEAQERGLTGNTGTPAVPPDGEFHVPVPQQLQIPAVPDTGQRDAAMAERNRVTEIMALCRDFDTDPSEHIHNGSTLEQVRAAILDGLRVTGAPVNAQVTRDEEDTFRHRASDALMMRAGLPVNSPAEGLVS